jgi:CysZ protein
MKDIAAGLSGFGGAFGFAMRHGLWWTFLVPLLLWLAFASGILLLGHGLMEQVSTWAAGYLSIDLPAVEHQGLSGAWDDVKAFLNGAREVIILVVLDLALFFLFLLVGKYLVLIALSPLLAYVSERTEEILTGRSVPFHWLAFLKEVGRGVLMALRSGFLELTINVVLWVASLLIAPLAPVAAVFLWLVSCWFYGFSMFDYVYERRRMGVRESLRAARGNRGMVMANGALFSLLMMIPLVGVVLAPILASIGAVLAEHVNSTKHASASAER